MLGTNAPILQVRQMSGQSHSSSHIKVTKSIDQIVVRITLVALFVIPLVAQYFGIHLVFGELKAFTLHLAAGLIAVLWSWQLSISLWQSRQYLEPRKYLDLSGWAGRNPARLAIIAVMAMLLAQALSTALSSLPRISFFGGDENFSGNSLYDSLSLTILFLTVAFKFRTRERLEQLAWVLIASGTIAAAYGVAQHFGWDPLGERLGNRVLSSFGNTINFAAYLVMAVPVTAAMALWEFRHSRSLQVVLVIALALQFMGLYFSGSRGPYVGVAAAVLALFATTVLVMGWRKVVQLSVIMLASAVIAGAVVAIPSSSRELGFTRVLSIGEQVTEFSSTSNGSTNVGGLEGRFTIWRSTLKITNDWDLPGEESSLDGVIRPLFGLGPEMYRYSIPLAGQPKSSVELIGHAHNYPLQILMGQGFVGLLLLIVFSGLVITAGWVTIRKFRSTLRPIDAQVVLLLAMVSALVGKMIESQTGVARISDLAMTFAVAGGVIALSCLVIEPVHAVQREARYSRLSFSISRQAWLGLSLSITTVATLLASLLVIGWDVRRLSTTFQIASASTSSEGEVVLKAWTDAQKSAPERQPLTMWLADKHFRSAKNLWSEDRPDDAYFQALRARELLLEFEKNDPFRQAIQLALAKTASTLVDWGYTDFEGEMRTRYLKIANNYPSYAFHVATAATAMVRVGDYEKAIELAERVIETEATTKPWAAAWYAKGVALFNMGSEDLAIATLITATEKEPGEVSARLAHSALAFIYERRGDSEQAEFHKAKAAN